MIESKAKVYALPRDGAAEDSVNHAFRYGYKKSRKKRINIYTKKREQTLFSALQKVMFLPPLQRRPIGKLM